MDKTMMMIEASWNNKPTFKLIPVSDQSPYNEGIYDPEQKVLALIGRQKKESLHMLPKINEYGDVQKLNVAKRNNGKDYAEERKLMETFYEYYLENPKDIQTLVNLVAVNAANLDLSKYEVAEAPKPSLLQAV